MDKRMIEERIRDLKENRDSGQGQLRQLEIKKSELEATLLRISGAIQVLEELLHENAEETGQDGPEVRQPQANVSDQAK